MPLSTQATPMKNMQLAFVPPPPVPPPVDPISAVVVGAIVLLTVGWYVAKSSPEKDNRCAQLLPKKQAEACKKEPLWTDPTAVMTSHIMIALDLLCPPKAPKNCIDTLAKKTIKLLNAWIPGSTKPIMLVDVCRKDLMKHYPTYRQFCESKGFLEETAPSTEYANARGGSPTAYRTVTVQDIRRLIARYNAYSVCQEEISPGLKEKCEESVRLKPNPSLKVPSPVQKKRVQVPGYEGDFVHVVTCEGVAVYVPVALQAQVQAQEVARLCALLRMRALQSSPAQPLLKEIVVLDLKQKNSSAGASIHFSNRIFVDIPVFLNALKVSSKSSARLFLALLVHEMRHLLQFNTAKKYFQNNGKWTDALHRGVLEGGAMGAELTAYPEEIESVIRNANIAYLNESCLESFQGSDFIHYLCATLVMHKLLQLYNAYRKSGVPEASNLDVLLIKMRAQNPKTAITQSIVQLFLRDTNYPGFARNPRLELMDIQNRVEDGLRRSFVRDATPATIRQRLCKDPGLPKMAYCGK